MRAALLLLCLAAGCRDYDALGRGAVPDQAIASDLGVRDLEGSSDASPDDLASLVGPKCDNADLAGTTPTNGLFGDSISLPSSSMDVLTEVRAGPLVAGQRDFLVFDPVTGNAVIYSPDQAMALARSLTDTSGAAPACVVTADLDGDGIFEIIACYPGSVVVWSWTGDVLTSLRTLTTTSDPEAIAVGDFDGDGGKDLFVFEDSGNAETFFDANPMTNMGMPTPYPFMISTPSAFTVFDENADCIDDLAYVGSDGSEGPGEVIHGVSSSGLGNSEAYPSINGANALGRAALGAPMGDGLYVLSLNEVDLVLGGNVVNMVSHTNASFAALTSGDLNRDGLTDFIVWDKSGAPHSYLVGSASTNYEFTPLTPPKVTLMPAVSPPILLDVDAKSSLVVATSTPDVGPSYCEGL